MPYDIPPRSKRLFFYILHICHMSFISVQVSFDFMQADEGEISGDREK